MAGLRRRLVGWGSGGSWRCGAARKVEQIGGERRKVERIGGDGAAGALVAAHCLGSG